MRSLLLVLLLGLLGGGVLLWLAERGEDGDVDPLVSGQDAGTDDDAGLMSSKADEVIVVQPASEWPADLMRDGVVFGDSRAVDEVEVVSPDGQDYTPTGAEVIAILEEKFKGTQFQFRFLEGPTLDDFKKVVLKAHIPARAPVRLILDMCRDAGFAFVAYGGKVYVAPVAHGELPGGGHVPEPPVEGFAPEPRGPR